MSPSDPSSFSATPSSLTGQAPPDQGQQKKPWWQDIVSHIGNKVGDYVIANLLPGGAGVPSFGHGGVVNKPTLAVVGDATRENPSGRERIVPAGRRYYGEK